MFCLLVSLVSAVYSMVSTISHILHLVTLSTSSCAPPLKTPSSWPADSCLCLSQYKLWQQGELVYPGTSCHDIRTLQYPLLVALIILNTLAMVITLTFMMILVCSKHNITFRNWRNIRNSDMSVRNVRWHQETHDNTWPVTRDHSVTHNMSSENFSPHFYKGKTYTSDNVVSYTRDIFTILNNNLFQC